MRGVERLGSVNCDPSRAHTGTPDPGLVPDDIKLA